MKTKNPKGRGRRVAPSPAPDQARNPSNVHQSRGCTAADGRSATVPTFIERLRGTGRTTRMLEHARKLDSFGRAVYIIADNSREVTRLTMLLGENIGGIKVGIALSLKNFDWQTMRLLGAHPNCVVLVDHHAIESRFRPMLEMLHAYDDR